MDLNECSVYGGEAVYYWKYSIHVFVFYGNFLSSGFLEPNAKAQTAHSLKNSH